MTAYFIVVLTTIITCTLFQLTLQDGQRSHNEQCSIRSQVANLFRENDSPEGCMTSKGLVCVSHKCVCADPSNVFEEPDKSTTSSLSDKGSQIAASTSTFFKKLVGMTTTTTAAPSSAAADPRGAKCVGWSGSPCFTETSTCVQHAKCEGSPKLCRCQGIYSSNAQGRCSKSSTVVSQVIKQTVG